MITTLIIKTDSAIRDEARTVANELGIPLTTVVNALLKQFVREQKIVLSTDPSPSKRKLALWESLSARMDKDKTKKFLSRDALFAHLGLNLL